jgi:hypothetical protein
MNQTIDLLQRTLEQVTDLVAKPIVKDKFWIVERDGQKVATIQSTDDGVVWVEGQQREKFPTVKTLRSKYKVEFTKPPRSKNTAPTHEVHGFPTSGKPHNALYDVKRRLPIYTKEDRSKSFYCAGYYLVLIGNNWSRSYCPKLITLQRYEHEGPWRTEEQQLDALRSKHGA